MNTEDLKSQLSASPRDLAVDYRIKISGRENGKRYDRLVGAKGLIEAVGIELANKFIERAYRELKPKYVCKLRRGIEITFYTK